MHSSKDSIVASLEIATAMPYFLASAAVCAPMQQPKTWANDAPGRLRTNPRTVDALVNVTKTGRSSSARTGAGSGVS